MQTEPVKVTLKAKRFGSNESARERICALRGGDPTLTREKSFSALPMPLPLSVVYALLSIG